MGSLYRQAADGPCLTTISALLLCNRSQNGKGSFRVLLHQEFEYLIGDGHHFAEGVFDEEDFGRGHFGERRRKAAQLQVEGWT